MDEPDTVSWGEPMKYVKDKEYWRARVRVLSVEGEGVVKTQG